MTISNIIGLFCVPIILVGCHNSGGNEILLSEYEEEFSSHAFIVGANGLLLDESVLFPPFDLKNRLWLFQNEDCTDKKINVSKEDFTPSISKGFMLLCSNNTSLKMGGFKGIIESLLEAGLYDFTIMYYEKCKVLHYDLYTRDRIIYKTTKDDFENQESSYARLLDSCYDFGAEDFEEDPVDTSDYNIRFAIQGGEIIVGHLDLRNYVVTYPTQNDDVILIRIDALNRLHFNSRIFEDESELLEELEDYLATEPERKKLYIQADRPANFALYMNMWAEINYLAPDKFIPICVL